MNIVWKTDGERQNIQSRANCRINTTSESTVDACLCLGNMTTRNGIALSARQILRTAMSTSLTFYANNTPQRGNMVHGSRWFELMLWIVFSKRITWALTEVNDLYELSTNDLASITVSNLLLMIFNSISASASRITNIFYNHRKDHWPNCGH